tara:strand:- start:178 stop:378 length:201 start_codon:yes stop_codon:yes gene_type:complete
MTNKEIKTEPKQKIDFDFFENYNSKIEIVGFRSAWISEFKEDMKEAYGDKKNDSEDKSTNGNNGDI